MKKFILGGASLILAGVFAFGVAAPAQADAFGSEPFAGSINLNGIPIPGGVLDHKIYGSDRTITEEWANSSQLATGQFCNWHTDFVYFDAATTKETARRAEAPVFRCQWLSVERVLTGRYVVPSYGLACALFYLEGKEVARQCHHITS